MCVVARPPPPPLPLPSWWGCKRARLLLLCIHPQDHTHGQKRAFFLRVLLASWVPQRARLMSATSGGEVSRLPHFFPLGPSQRPHPTKCVREAPHPTQSPTPRRVAHTRKRIHHVLAARTNPARHGVPPRNPLAFSRRRREHACVCPSHTHMEQIHSTPPHPPTHPHPQPQPQPCPSPAAAPPRQAARHRSSHPSPNVPPAPPLLLLLLLLLLLPPGSPPSSSPLTRCLWGAGPPALLLLPLCFLSAHPRLTSFLGVTRCLWRSRRCLLLVPLEEEEEEEEEKEEEEIEKKEKTASTSDSEKEEIEKAAAMAMPPIFNSTTLSLRGDTEPEEEEA